jgi:inorganic pyrophosphatase
MDLSKIPIGRDPPRDVNVVVEIPQGGEPVKYELDKASGAVFVDRFLHTAMFYPGNYGFVPHTLAEDGDPIDVLIVGPAPVVPGAVVRCRPIGAQMMRDEHGPDEKIIAVPVDALHPFYTGVRSTQDLPPIPVRPDRPLLPALQGSRIGQMGRDRALGGCGRGCHANRRGDCPRHGLTATQTPQRARPN